MARKLQDRLALANYKAQHGLDNLSFNLVEAHLENSIKRKRPGSSTGASSDTSSTSSGVQLFSSALASSPTTAPIFSDDINGPGSSQGYRKRKLYQPAFVHPSATSGSRKRSRAHSMAPPFIETSRTSWKTTHHLPESSPIHHHHAHFGPNISFASETSTIPDSPTFGGHVSDDDEAHDLPSHSFSSHAHPKFTSSPPRTPPPTRNRALRNRKSTMNATAGEEGADLLLYLATSPSPANPTQKPRIFAPSTPPSNQHALPSSMMTTPGGGGSYMAGFNTPGQQFNFADFVNITPSPAQGAFGSRTPGLPKTPLAAKEARRRLNFDSLVPPGGSPNVSNAVRAVMSKETGLGMELGGELVSWGWR